MCCLSVSRISLVFLQAATISISSPSKYTSPLYFGVTLYRLTLEKVFIADGGFILFKRVRLIQFRGLEEYMVAYFDLLDYLFLFLSELNGV